jgi:hypothetical protein
MEPKTHDCSTTFANMKRTPQICSAAFFGVKSCKKGGVVVCPGVRWGVVTSIHRGTQRSLAR